MRKVHDGGKRYHWTYTYMHVKKYNISGALIQSDCFYENHLKYQTGYKGKYDLYFLKGDFMPGMNGGTIYYSYYVTHHELQEINMNNLSPDTFYHRFSGKISKHTFYPYP